MPKTATIHARIEPKLKHQAESVLERVGLSASEAINVFYRLIVSNKGLPFPVRIPNSETKKALRDIQAGRNVKTAKTLEEFYKAVGLE